MRRRTRDQHVHVLQIVVVEPRAVQAPEERPEAACQRPPGDASASGIRVVADRAPADVGRLAAGHLARDEEASREDAGAVELDRRHEIRRGEVVRRERPRPRPRRHGR